MTERLLQFIWKMQYFNKLQLQTTGGETLHIFHPGQSNSNQGPDFLQASIQVADTTWVGSIEIHTHSSLWNTHGHHRDKNYNNVILHVVWEQDADIKNEKEIPMLVLQNRVSKLLLQRYGELMHNIAFIPCENSLRGVSSLTWSAWKERLAAERLERRSGIIRQQLAATRNHWEEVFWWTLARNFGVTVNSEAFEAVARSVSINILAKYKNQLNQLECLLLGQAGLLTGKFSEEYPRMLQREYSFLQKKHMLQRINLPVHFLRMRPQNFPTVRLAQLAQLIHHSTHLFSKIKESAGLQEVKKLLQVTANDYWHYHYRFDEQSAFKEKTLGKQMIENIIVNTIIPVLFSYGHIMNEPSYKARALQWLQEMPGEQNTLTRRWKSLEVMSETAMDSQALTELTKEYCLQKNCLSCAIGNSILRDC